MHACVITPEIVGPIREVAAYYADEAGTIFATVVMWNGDVIDVDALDVVLAEPAGITEEHAQQILGKIAEAGYALVKLPEERENGDYQHVELSCGEVSVMRTARRFNDDPNVVREIAAELLRAAAQLESLQDAQ
ncbi:hypothetical protein [Rhodococcus opacus]|uniref:hypothetical protein n=1 Tax=Rhodococcus opacus TaxID=37919 RepID=UPI001C4603FC|nr:hypothetical protein [Rhodococcus opacus]MBV6758410.1 hypothetical protein [Rhodococcus opacus]